MELLSSISAADEPLPPDSPLMSALATKGAGPEVVSRRQALEPYDRMMSTLVDPKEKHTQFLKQQQLECLKFRSRELTNLSQSAAYVIKKLEDGSYFQQVLSTVSDEVVSRWRLERTFAPPGLELELLVGANQHQPRLKQLIKFFHSAGVYGNKVLKTKQQFLFGDEAITLVFHQEGEIVGAICMKLLQMLSGFFCLYITLAARSDAYVALPSEEAMMAYALSELTRLVQILSQANPERTAGSSVLMVQSVGFSYSRSSRDGSITKKTGVRQQPSRARRQTIPCALTESRNLIPPSTLCTDGKSTGNRYWRTNFTPVSLDRILPYSYPHPYTPSPTQPYPTSNPNPNLNPSPTLTSTQPQPLTHAPHAHCLPVQTPLSILGGHYRLQEAALHCGAARSHREGIC